MQLGRPSTTHDGLDNKSRSNNSSSSSSYEQFKKITDDTGAAYLRPSWEYTYFYMHYITSCNKITTNKQIYHDCCAASLKSPSSKLPHEAKRNTAEEIKQGQDGRGKKTKQNRAPKKVKLKNRLPPQASPPHSTLQHRCPHAYTPIR